MGRKGLRHRGMRAWGLEVWDGVGCVGGNDWHKGAKIEARAARVEGFCLGLRVFAWHPPGWGIGD